MKDKILKCLLNNRIWIVGGIILFSFFSPFLFTRQPISNWFDKEQPKQEIKQEIIRENKDSHYLDFTETGQIGDTMGGIMNPFISIAAVIVTGLAFYTQYKANDMVKKQFELQKFENQFHERLKLHKENVNELEIEIKSKCFLESNKTFKGRTAFFKILEELEDIIKKEKDNFNDRNTFQNNVYKKFYDKYGKYISHYFRHLFHTVKFVVKQKDEVIKEEQKREYLQILRAQMSNDEQKLLFYNWLATGYGGT